MFKRLAFNPIGFVSIVTIIAISLGANFGTRTAFGSPYPPPELVDPSQTTEADSTSNPYPGPMETSSPGVPLPSEPHGPSENNALMMDAKGYAATFGVDIDEAFHRMQLQADIGELNRKLSDNEGDIFAGLWIQHLPVFRVIVLFTRDGEEVIKSYEISSLKDIIELRIVSATLQELEAARFEAVQNVSDLNIRVSSAINIPYNRAEIYVTDPKLLILKMNDVGIRLPNDVQIVEFLELSREVADIYGGLALSSGTSGFSVIDLFGVRGITTAGHCEDELSYNGVDLPFKDDIFAGPYDIQWNQADHAFDVRNLIWDGTYNRFIFNVRFRASQSVGEWVCKFGKITGYACGTIATTSQDGINVRVDNMLLQIGDSGGPWFSVNTAYGTSIASCTLANGNPCAIYGPVDQIYDILGISILPARTYYLPFVSR